MNLEMLLSKDVVM